MLKGVVGTITGKNLSKTNLTSRLIYYGKPRVPEILDKRIKTNQFKLKKALKGGGCFLTLHDDVLMIKTDK